MTLSVDPITLAVVQGVLESIRREMTLTIEKTSRSSVFNIARDYSLHKGAKTGLFCTKGHEDSLEIRRVCFCCFCCFYASLRA